MLIALLSTNQNEFQINKKMKRREFIQKTAASSAFLSINGLAPLYSATPKISMSSIDSANLKHITILHTNDVHSYIDPFPLDDPKNPGMGGVAKRAEVISKIRNENPNVLLLDAGDIFQGTPYFNYYGGELEFKLMSMMKYDASAIGNHDFDNGLEGILSQLPNATFDFLSANYDFKNTIMDGHVQPFKIFNIDGIKIGVFGLGVELSGLVDKKNYKETVYNDPTEISTDMVRVLKVEKKCDLIICLSHIGYSYKSEPNRICDLKLAVLPSAVPCKATASPWLRICSAV